MPNIRRIYVQTLVGFPAKIGLQQKKHLCAIVLFGLLACGNGYAQTAIPSPSPTPTPITKTDTLLVNNPSTVGRITKWVGSSKNGIGTIGDSVITESTVGTIGIGTNPFSDFKLAVDGSSTLGGLFGQSTGSATGVSGYSPSGTGTFGQSMDGFGVRGISATGTGVFGQSNTGLAGSFQGNVNVSGFLSTGNLSLNPGGSFKFSDGTVQSTATNDSAIVHLAGAETITGSKTFNGFQLFSGNVGIGMHGPITDTLLNVGGNTGVVSGTFINNHNTSLNDALFALHTGRGNAFRALNTQVIGRAGFFENSHTNSTSPVVETLGHGPGPAFKASNTGTGPAAVFTSGNVGIGTAAPQAKFHVANTGGTAGQFDGNVTVNGNLTLTGSTNISPTVNHDSTLSGDGTTSSPLSVLSAPNGVVTTGSYANPSWITSLDGNKITQGTVVRNVNGLGDSVTLAAGDNITITPSGNTLTISASANGPSAPALNPLQLATLRWYGVNEAQQNIEVGNVQPLGLAFDGANMWVVNFTCAGCQGVVSKHRLSDGAVLGVANVGSAPVFASFDGSNIWVGNRDSNNVTKLRASDGAVMGTFPTGGSAPQWSAFDGANLWVTNTNSNSVTRMRTSDGSILNTYGTGSRPHGVVFDGSNVWVANAGSSSVTKLRASDGANQGTFAVGAEPVQMAFDGSNIWVSNLSGNTVSKLRASDGATLGTFSVSSPHGIAFDGVNIWVVSEFGNTVTKLRASDGSVLTTSVVGNLPWGIAFDGINMWISNLGSNSISKR